MDPQGSSSRTTVSAHTTIAPEPLAKLFGFRKISEVLDRLGCARLVVGQGDTKDPLPRPLYHHQQISCDTCAQVQQPDIGHTCLFASLEIVEPGIIRLPRCFRHQIAGEGCETEGTRLVLDPIPEEAVWDEWTRNGFASCESAQWASHIELRVHGGEIKRLEVDQSVGARGVKRKRSIPPMKWNTGLDSAENGVRETYEVDAEDSIFGKTRLQPSSLYRPGPTQYNPSYSSRGLDVLVGSPNPTTTPSFSMRPTQSFRPASRYPLTPASPTTAHMRGLSHSSSVLQDVPLLSPDDADLRACFDDFRQTMRRTLVGPWEAMLPKVLEPLDSLGTRWVQMKAEMRSGIKNEVPEQEHAERTRRQASEIDAASAEVERQRLRVRDAEVRLHQVEANLRDAQAHARRVEHELAGRTEERDKAVESKKQGLEQMVGRLRDAEGRTEALRTEKQALVAELDQLKKEHVEEVGREKAKATKLRKQAAEETMRVNDLEKQLKAARDTDGPKNEIKATSLRVEGRIRELEREIEILVGAVSEAARQRDLAVKDATAAKARLDESAGELQAARNMASRLEITRQRQAEDIEVLRASAKEHAAKHDGFVARTMADRATFFGEKKKLTVKVAELEAALAATKNAASAGQSAEAMRLGSEIDKLRVELEQMRGQAEDARKEVEVQKQAAKEANEKVVEEQVQAATAWTTVQKIIAENGRSASEREIRVSQGKKDAEATVRAKEKELEVMRKDLSNAKTLAGALAAEQDQLRSEFEVQLNEERAKVEAIGQKLAMLEQSTGQAASRDADAEQKIKAASSRAKRAQAERDVAVEEVAKLRSELDDLRSRAKTGGTGAEHLPTPRSAATEDDVSMRDDYDTTVFSIGESTAADPTLIGDPDALCDEVGIDPGSVDDAAPKTLASQIKARDREIAVLRKKLEKVEGLEEEIVQNRKMAGKWSRRVDNSLAVIKILETKVKELEKERAAKWKKGTNPVYLEMTVPQELARARMMLRTMRNEVLPKCSCAIGMEDQRLNLADSRDRVEIVLETRSTGQYPLWKASDGDEDAEDAVEEGDAGAAEDVGEVAAAED